MTPAARADLLLAPTLTLLETAQILGCGMSALRDALRRGQLELPLIRVGARVVIPTAAVRRLLSLEEVDLADQTAPSALVPRTLQ